jgi:hypothetical protein
MNNLLAALLSGSGTMFDHSYSVAVESGLVAQNDVDWNMMDYWQRGTGGVRVGYAMSPNMELLGSIHHGVQSTSYDNYYYGDYDYEYTSSELNGYAISVSETFIHVGPKFSWNLTNWFSPYATAQGVLIHNRLQMADGYSINEEDDSTYVDTSAMGVGLTGALGLELRLRPIAKKTQLFTYFETGATTATPLNFVLGEAAADGSDINIGDLGYGGGYYRLGLGTKF